MAITSQHLERQVNRETDLAGKLSFTPSPLGIFSLMMRLVFRPADLDQARTQWLILLNERMKVLDRARGDVRNDFDYGGAAAVCDAHADLENEVDEARRMVCALSSEMRRRSEGEVLVWKEDTPPLTTIILGGMIKSSSCQ